MGGEACLWSEYADASNYVSRLFPRASAVSERLWTAADVRFLFEISDKISDSFVGLESGRSNFG